MEVRKFGFFAVLLAAAFILGQTVPVPVSAASGFSFSLDRASAGAGEVVSLELRLGSRADVAGFRAFAGYDDSKLELIGTEGSAPMESGTLTVNSGANPVCAVYVCNAGAGHAPALSGTVLTFLFRVRDGVSDGSAGLRASVDETCDYDGKDLRMDAGSSPELQISHRPGGSGVQLSLLEPAQGTLNPAFSPDILNYTLPVGPQVHSVSFRTDSPAGTSVKISRTALYAAGSETPIRITVTSSDRKEKTDYCVTVLRAAEGTGQTASADVQRNGFVGSAGKQRALSSGPRKQGNRFSSGSGKKKTAAVSGTKNSPAENSSSGSAAWTSAPVVIAGKNVPAYLVLILGASLFAALGIIAGLLLGRKK